MKKIFFYAAVAAMFFGFSACSDEDPAEAVNTQQSANFDNYGKATIKGVILLDSRQEADNNGVQQTVVYEFAPQGTKLFVTATVDTYKYYAEEIIGANGTYEFQVPAGIDGTSTVKIVTDEVKPFPITYKTIDGAGPAYKDTIVYKTLGAQTINLGALQPNGTKFDEQTVSLATLIALPSIN